MSKWWPPKNTFARGKVNWIKKIQYFLEFVRTSYYLETNQFNSGFIDKLSAKSSNTKEDTKTLVDYIVFLKSKTNHTEQELIELNKKIEHSQSPTTTPYSAS